MHEVLDTGTKVSSSSPDVLDEGDLFWVDLQLFGEPAIVELHTFLFKEYIFVGGIEHLNTQHNEAGIVPTGESDVV